MKLIGISGIGYDELTIGSTYWFRCPMKCVHPDCDVYNEYLSWIQYVGVLKFTDVFTHLGALTYSFDFELKNGRCAWINIPLENEDDFLNANNSIVIRYLA